MTNEYPEPGLVKKIKPIIQIDFYDFIEIKYIFDVDFDTDTRPEYYWVILNYVGLSIKLAFSIKTVQGSV